MEAVPLSIFRKNLKHYIEDVNDNADPILVTNRKKGSESAVVISQRDYDNLIENLTILGNPDLVKKIKEGNMQIDEGQTQQHELIDD